MAQLALFASPSSPRAPRLYESIWLQLRWRQVCVLSVADEAAVRRIKRGISKEKDQDEGFKLLNNLEKFYLKFSWNEKTMELKVELLSKQGVGLMRPE